MWPRIHVFAAKRVTRDRDLAAQAKPSSEMASGRTREPGVGTRYINARLHPFLFMEKQNFCTEKIITVL